MNATEKTKLFDALVQESWIWKGEALFAPNETLWLDVQNPWHGDLQSFLERMTQRTIRIQQNLDATSTNVEEIRKSLDDTNTLVRVLKMLSIIQKE